MVMTDGAGIMNNIAVANRAIPDTAGVEMPAIVSRQTHKAPHFLV